MAWRKGCEEVANSKPLFLTIYTVVIIGIVVSSFFVFSAIYSTNPPSAQSSAWLSSISSDETRVTDQTLKVSRSAAVLIVPTPSPGSQNEWPTSIWDDPPPNKKMPPLEDFRLTKKLVQQRVKDNAVIVTFGNYAFMDFILTWVKQLRDLGVSNFLVGAMDTKLVEALYWKGIPVFDMGSHMSTVDVGWGSPTFHKMGREKVILIDSILPFGFELLMCDTDMVWLKNPLPYLARYPEADVLTSSDQVIPTVVDDSLENWPEVSGAYNIGIFHWRPTESAKKLAKQWKEMLLADDQIWDQNGFNDIVHRQLGPSVDDESGLVFAFDGKLKLGILPASIFCSGHTYFVQAMYQQLRLEPYAVHTTFQYGGTEGKRHRLREAMLFLDPPEYYNPPGGFLSFKPHIPKNLLLSGEHNVESHFTLVNYQIKQIRAALAIASLLDRTLAKEASTQKNSDEGETAGLGSSELVGLIAIRAAGTEIRCTVKRGKQKPEGIKRGKHQTNMEWPLTLVTGQKGHWRTAEVARKVINVAGKGAASRRVHQNAKNKGKKFARKGTVSIKVMPPLWCRIDRLWYAHPGILEGSMTRQPFLCPLDHVFEVNVMLKKLPEEEFGPQIDFREYSILDNPSLPSEVKKSWLDVQLCKEGTQDCDASASNDTNVGGGVLKFPKHSNEETFMKVFSSFKDVKVIKFSSVQEAFTGFTDKARTFCFFDLKKGKINSETVLSGMWAYGVVCRITLLVTYIMICTGMRNQDGKQFLLKLLRMIIHLIEITLDLC
ncbi:Arabinosyltransferase isoform B [Glycine soja]|uniref:Arabinosyltransferase isoform B n=1 Tax=Glycine soja TaxID=3848 RepID=A0A445GH97_GLYSO|nr:Arabinosyltransferase isoform B [Glycine soja]